LGEKTHNGSLREKKKTKKNNVNQNNERQRFGGSLNKRRRVGKKPCKQEQDKIGEPDKREPRVGVEREKGLHQRYRQIRVCEVWDTTKTGSGVRAKCVNEQEKLKGFAIQKEFVP